MICTVLRAVIICQVCDLDKKILQKMYSFLQYFLVEPTGIDSRLRARSGCVLTPTGCHSFRTRSTPYFFIIKKQKQGVKSLLLFFGGTEGSRTPVQKPIDITFSVGSHSLLIPVGAAG